MGVDDERPGPFTPGTPGTHCTEGWVGPRAGPDGYGKSGRYRDSITGLSSPYHESERCKSQSLLNI